jgi:hypothetical protein
MKKSTMEIKKKQATKKGGGGRGAGRGGVQSHDCTARGSVAGSSRTPHATRILVVPPSRRPEGACGSEGCRGSSDPDGPPLLVPLAGG